MGKNNIKFLASEGIFQALGQHDVASGAGQGVRKYLRIWNRMHFTAASSTQPTVTCHDVRRTHNCNRDEHRSYYDQPCLWQQMYTTAMQCIVNQGTDVGHTHEPRH